jgi:hypothetical protein
MTDEKHYRLVEDFANSHSVAIGGGIRVDYSCHHTSYRPQEGRAGMKYEDVNYLKEQIDGASSFLFWLRRNGYDIKKQIRKREKT